MKLPYCSPEVSFSETVRWVFEIAMGWLLCLIT